MKLVQLGRQSKISLAELESKFGAQNINPINNEFAVVNAQDLDINKFGGLQRVADVLDELPANSIWGFIQKYIPSNLEKEASKTNIGFSFYGTAPITTKNIFGLKTKLKKQGHKVRIVNTSEKPLNNAQVLHNKLDLPENIEITAVSNQGKVIIASTCGIQNISAYSNRDFDRPRRDTFVGMLPPKLAQIIINLASPQDKATILDPFCGTGVLLQEALLMGYSVIGSDISKRMVSYTAENLEWLSKQYPIKTSFSTELADATNAQWAKFDTVASEIYLGEPLKSMPDTGKLKKLQSEIDEITTKTLKNLHSQLKESARICLAVPVWNTSQGLKHITTLDHLEELGYNRLSFKHASDLELIYQREDQVVARELIVLIRK